MKASLNYHFLFCVLGYLFTSEKWVVKLITEHTLGSLALLPPFCTTNSGKKCPQTTPFWSTFSSAGEWKEGGQFGQCLKVYNIFFFEGFPKGVLVLYRVPGHKQRTCYSLSLDVATGQARYCLMIQITDEETMGCSSLKS